MDASKERKHEVSYARTCSVGSRAVFTSCQDSQDLQAIPFWSIPLANVGPATALTTALPLFVPFFTIGDILEWKLYLVCKTWLQLFVGRTASESLFTSFNVVFEGIKEFPVRQSPSTAVQISKHAGTRLPTVTDFLKQLTRLPLTSCGYTLTHLSFEFCSAFTVEHIRFLPSRLLSLNLNGCQSISDAALRLLAQRCPRLQHLQLYWNVHITDAGLIDLLKTEKRSESNNETRDPCLRYGFLFLNLSGCKLITDRTIHALLYHQQKSYYPAKSTVSGSYLPSESETTLPSNNLSDNSSNEISFVDTDFFETNRLVCKFSTDIQASSTSPIYPIPPQRTPLSLGVHSCSAMSYSLPYNAAVGVLELDLTKCLHISETGLRIVCEGLFHLRKLILYGCNHLKPSAYTQLYFLKQLQILDLCGTLVSDVALVRMLTQCTMLRCIDLSWCLSLSDETLMAFSKHLNPWEWISFHGNRSFSLPSFEDFLNSPSTRFLHSLDIQGCVALSKYQHAEGITKLREKCPWLQHFHLHH